MTERTKTRRISQEEYGANRSYYDSLNLTLHDIPGVEKRRLVGYRPLEHVQTPGGWASSPEYVETEIVVRGDYEGLVELSVMDVPQGIEATLLPVSGGKGDLGVEVSGSGDVTIKDGVITSGPSSGLTLHLTSETRVRLRVGVDSTSDPMAGTHTITVRASDGNGNSVEETFTLRAIDVWGAEVETVEESGIWYSGDAASVMYLSDIWLVEEAQDAIDGLAEWVEKACKLGFDYVIDKAIETFVGKLASKVLGPLGVLFDMFANASLAGPPYKIFSLV